MRRISSPNVQMPLGAAARARAGPRGAARVVDDAHGVDQDLGGVNDGRPWVEARVCGIEKWTLSDHCLLCSGNHFRRIDCDAIRAGA
jgi:hypothetical protein